jgi:hypothetical protein
VIRIGYRELDLLSYTLFFGLPNFHSLSVHLIQLFGAENQSSKHHSLGYPDQ